MSEDERATFASDEKGKVQIDREGNLYISGSDERVLSEFDLKNISTITRSLKKDSDKK